MKKPLQLAFFILIFSFTSLLAISQPKIQVTQAKKIVLNNAEYDFGDASALGAGVGKNVRFYIENIGNAELFIASVNLSTPEFTILGEIPTKIAPTASVSLIVRYAPSLAQAQAGMLIIESNDPLVNNFNINLKGNGSTLGCTSDLIFSEYVEGTANNKALEIYNGTGKNIDLSNYRILSYNNGSNTISLFAKLSGIIANGASMVYKNGLGTIPIGQSIVPAAFNGNDAMVLYSDAADIELDIIGRIGEDPGTAWVATGLSTENMTLRRDPLVREGVFLNPDSGFPTLATQWLSAPIDDFSNLGTHTVSCIFVPLPIQLLSFSGKLNQLQEAELTWLTASEKDNKGFEIEKSLDAKNFTSIGFVQGIGNSQNLNSYFFTDAHCTQLSYYRLKQIDENNSYTYSPIISLSPKNVLQLGIYPNPFSEYINIKLSGTNGDIQLSLYNVLGTQLVNLQGSIEKVNGDLNQYLTNLSKGNYLIKIMAENKLFNAKITKY